MRPDQILPHRRVILLAQLSLSLTLLLSGCSSQEAGVTDKRETEHPGTFATIIKNYPGSQIDGYNIYLPPAYDEQTDSRFPVIVFLQGGLAVGGKVGDIFKWELPKELRESKNLDTELGQLKLNTFIYLMPHITQGEYYHSDKGLALLLEEFAEKYRIDNTRIYLTGLSRGGYGTWGLASKMPERFAAIAPIAGSAVGVRNFSTLADLPIWASHNIADEKVHHYSTATAIQKLEKSGSPIFHQTQTVAEVDYLQHDHIFTSGKNPTYEHDAWTEMYNNVNFYKWLLRFQRKEPNGLVD